MFQLPVSEQGRAALAVSAAGHLLATLGALAAVLSFTRSDRMRRAWMLMTVSSVIGVLLPVAFNYTTFHDDPGAAEPFQSLRLTALVVALNATDVAGLALFSRAWRGVGVVPPWHRLATAVALAVGLLVAGPALYHDLLAAGAGGVSTYAILVSDVGDIASITLTGPLLASALWLRGGSLVWPFLYLAASCMAWLLYDAGGFLDAQRMRYSDTFFSLLGMLFIAAAGVAHRQAVIGRRSLGEASS